jgi:5-formyltetrahydrofolate cyclo-ligase
MEFIQPKNKERKQMIKNIKLFKTKLRQKYRSLRENMNKDEKQALDKRILDKILILKKYKESKVVFTYISKEIEVDTFGLIKKSLSENKKVAVPACNKEDRTMEFYFVTSQNDLEKGTFGLLEPIKEKCEKAVDFSEGFCIVPGFCFDYKGYRLGYGYGYYDRFLQRFGGTTVGICYNKFITPQLPHGKFDRPVDILVTNRYIKEIQSN